MSMKQFMYSIGEPVQTKKYNYSGIIRKRYSFCPGDDDWVKNQSIKLTLKDIKNNWYLVAIKDIGTNIRIGSVFIHEDDIL